jgi:LEA14-like dessication related protein
MVRRMLILLLLVCTVALSGCATLKELIQKPTVAFESVTFQDMSLFDGTLVFSFKVTNPNPIGINLDKIGYDLKIGDKDLVKGTIDKGLSLKARGTETVELPISINYLDFFKSITDFINSDKIKYDLSGFFQIAMLSIPYQAKGSLDIPKIPEISLKNIQVKNISFTGASLLMTLEIDNNNPFAVAIKSLNYGINLGGAKFANGATTKPTDITKNGKSTVEIPVYVDFLKLGRSAYKLLTKSSTGYELTGNMKISIPKVGDKEFPFSKVGQIPIGK